MAGNTVRQVTTYLVSAVYVMAGALKYPIVPSVYKDMKAKFVDYCTVLPTKAAGVDHVTFMYGVGTAELLMGLGLLLGQRKVKVMCTQGLMFIMAGAVYTLVRLGDYGEAAIPSTCFAALAYLCYSYSTEKDLKKTE